MRPRGRVPVHPAAWALNRILDRADPPTAAAVAAEAPAVLRLGPVERDRLRWDLAGRMASEEFTGCYVLLGGRVSPSLPPDTVGGLLWLVRDHARRSGWHPPEPIPRVIAVGAAALAGLHLRPGPRAEALRVLAGLAALPVAELERHARPPATAPPPSRGQGAQQQPVGASPGRGEEAKPPIGWTPHGPRT